MWDYILQELQALIFMIDELKCYHRDEWVFPTVYINCFKYSHVLGIRGDISIKLCINKQFYVLGKLRILSLIMFNQVLLRDLRVPNPQTRYGCVLVLLFFLVCLFCFPFGLLLMVNIDRNVYIQRWYYQSYRLVDLSFGLFSNWSIQQLDWSFMNSHQKSM